MDTFLALQIVGAAFLLLAYWGHQVWWWSEMSYPYLGLNTAGAAMLATTAWLEYQYGFAVLNTVWCLVAIRSYFFWRKTRP